MEKQKISIKLSRWVNSLLFNKNRLSSCPGFYFSSNLVIEDLLLWATRPFWIFNIVNVAWNKGTCASVGRGRGRSLSFGNERGLLPSSGKNRKSNSMLMCDKIYYFLNSLQQYVTNVYNVLVCHGTVGQTLRIPRIFPPFEKLKDMMGKWNFPEIKDNFTG